VAEVKANFLGYTKWTKRQSADRREAQKGDRVTPKNTYWVDSFAKGQGGDRGTPLVGARGRGELMNAGNPWSMSETEEKGKCEV